MRLHYAPQTRAVRPRWLLEELGVPFELVRASPADVKALPGVPQSAEVPVLEDGPLVLFEPLSICLYLADRFADRGFAPALGTTDRGDYLQWLLIADARLEAIVVEHLRAEASTPNDKLTALLDAIAKRLEGREVVVGTTFTAADLVLASILHLANRLHLLDGHPSLVAYVRRHTSRPAARRAVS